MWRPRFQISELARTWGRRLYLFSVIAKSLSFSLNRSTVCNSTFIITLLSFILELYRWNPAFWFPLIFLNQVVVNTCQGSEMSETGYSSEGEWKLSNLLSSVLIWYFYFVCRNGVEIIRERIRLYSPLFAGRISKTFRILSSYFLIWAFFLHAEEFLPIFFFMVIAFYRKFEST